MNPMLYIAFSTLCLSLFYVGYYFGLRNQTQFSRVRKYLLFSMVMAMIVPLMPLQINMPQFDREIAFAEIVSVEGIEMPVQNIGVSVEETKINTPAIETNTFNFMEWINGKKKFMFGIYISIVMVLLFRLLFQVATIIGGFVKSKKQRQGYYLMLFGGGFKHSFSFFRWIFVGTEELEKEDLEQILAHEKIHASQFHSIDLLMVELLAAVMWFNPLVWKMRNEIQLVHEYLADEGALNTGIDKLQYQALLVNQVSEEKLLGLSSSFNHSLIKKRMIMMTKNKVNKRKTIKWLYILPFLLVMVLAMGTLKGCAEKVEEAIPEEVEEVKVEDVEVKGVENEEVENQNDEVVAAIAPTKMNVMYVGVDNPVSIAVSGYEASELEVSITNGVIEGSNGNYMVMPRRPGNSIIEVKVNGKVIQKAEFRVKKVPDPVAKVAGMRSGAIDKALLLEQEGVTADMENFDFDLRFKITEFVMTATIKGFARSIPTKGNKLSQEQKNLIQNLGRNDKLYIEGIKAMGPDGIIRELPTITLKIN